VDGTAEVTTLKMIVCGGRNYADRQRLDAVLDAAVARLGLAEIVHGGARGADSMAGEWALARGIPVKEFPADWANEGRSAGPRRNHRMLVEGRPDAVIAFPGGRGTANMVAQARAAGIPVYEIT